MNNKEKIIDKFGKLLEEGKKILQQAGWDGNNYTQHPSDIDYLRWKTEAINLVKRACGETSEHYLQLKRISEDNGTKLNSFYFTHCYGTLEAAFRDFNDDFLFDIKLLIRAELIDDFLSQAEYLLQEGYHIPAASLAGGVLEDSLRKLCDKHEISCPEKTKIDKLNTSLAKANIYDKLTQKEITAKADIRNNADHGHYEKIKQINVEEMIRWVRRFVLDHLS